MQVALRSALAFLLGLLLLSVQSMLSRELVPYPWTPQLLLPLVVYYGLLAEVAVARGIAIAFACGYFFDLFSGVQMGLHTFVMSASFLAARLLGTRLFLRNLPLQSVFAFIACLAAHGTSYALRSIFETPSPFELADRSREVQSMAFSSLSTAVVAPLVFAIVSRIEAGEQPRREATGAPS